MAISGLVLTIKPDAADDVLTRLIGDDRLTVGERQGHRLPVVAETASAAADRALWEELGAIPGVVRVDVASVHFDRDDAGASAGPGAGTGRFPRDDHADPAPGRGILHDHPHPLTRAAAGAAVVTSHASHVLQEDSHAHR